jgi:hypothetical protein
MQWERILITAGAALIALVLFAFVKTVLIRRRQTTHRFTISNDRK